MAANKRKILENARKLAQKGSKDKALAEYQKLVKLDPRDAKLRLEIGDAFRRWGDVAKAIETYTKVADQYTKEGFDARAVAVYKQILNLDPERSESYEPLAELYERMGLTAEAINALQMAADGFHKAGKRREALELLRKMSSIDPTNTNSRIKVAELLRQEDMLEEAVLEYSEVAEELARQGDAEAAGKIYQRVLEIDPNRLQTIVAFARNLIEQRKSAEAESLAKRALAKDDQEPVHYELLADIYRAQGRDDLLPQVYRPLADVYRARGEEERAREILQRFVPPDSISIDTDASGLESSDELFLDAESDVPGNTSQALEPDDELSLDGDSFGEGGDAMELGPELEIGGGDALDLGLPLGRPDAHPQSGEGADPLLEPKAAEATFMEATPLRPPPEAVAERAKQEEVEPPPPSGDPEQLLAEASVYLRYGKRERAIVHLEAILEQQPDHRVALEKLGEAHAEGGDADQAVAYWLEAAKLAGDASDAAAVAVLRGRIEALDPEAAESLAPEPDPEPEAEQQPEPVIEEPEVPDDFGDASSDDFEIDIDVDVDDLELGEEPQLEEALEGPPEKPPKAAARKPAEPAASRSGDASLSSTTAQQILEDLEEADFYMEQGLHGEAEEIYKRVLAIAPNHPRALVRLGEVAAARGEDPGSTGTDLKAKVEAPKRPKADAAPATPAPPVGSEAPADDPEIPELDDEPLEDLAPPDDEPPPPIDAPDDAGLDLGLAADAEEFDPVDEDTGLPLDLDEETDADEQTPSEEETGEFSVPTESYADAPAAQDLPAADPGASFDLAAELSDVFDDESSGPGSTAGDTDDGFAAVFDAFKRGVSETLSEADHAAHYDLGIAYKEMGLLDDAIQEFRAAMVHPPRVVECLHLIALCALDAGQGQLAVEHLEQLLEGESADDAQRLAAHFDLGRAHESLGAIAEARAVYEAVQEVDASYQDVGERLAGLPEAKPESPGTPEADAASDGDGFESFEDVISETADEEPQAEDTGETFSDLLSEVDEDEAAAPQASDDVDADTADDVPEAQPEPEPVARPAEPRPAAARKKRKKISFV